MGVKCERLIECILQKYTNLSSLTHPILGKKQVFLHTILHFAQKVHPKSGLNCTNTCEIGRECMCFPIN